MSVRIFERHVGETTRVVIAGGGVAALEALLALRALAGGRVEINLLAPNREFFHQPLAVAEPFEIATPRRLELRVVAADTGARWCRDSLASIDADERVARTSGGDAIPYDALLVAVGARRLRALPGAITYRGAVDNRAFRTLLGELESGAVKHVAFAVPREARWAVALYDLALLTAGHLAGRGIDAKLTLVTHEAEPLGLFGSRASRGVRRLLEENGIALRTSETAEGAGLGMLFLEGGERLRADRVVALPKLAVPRIAGLPQGPDGFIGTNRDMQVESLARVYAAGDAIWFPIKQGGIATQQADIAARSIARLAGVELEREAAPFRPVLRGALLTAEGPHFLSSSVGSRNRSSTSSDQPLWWPPGKIAGRYLTPYLYGKSADLAQPEITPELADLRDAGGPAETARREHRETVELALRAAELDAGCHDYRGALRWLKLVEDLDLALPQAFADRRRRWRRVLDEEVEAHGPRAWS